MTSGKCSLLFVLLGLTADTRSFASLRGPSKMATHFHVKVDLGSVAESCQVQARVLGGFFWALHTGAGPGVMSTGGLHN